MRSLHSASTSISHPARRGGVLLELILSLPLLVILLLAVVEYAVLMANQQQLEMAARAGALVSTTLELAETGTVPDVVLNAIAVELANIGIDLQAGIDDGSIRIELEHNYYINGSLPELDPSARLVSGTLACPPPNSPPAPDPDDSAYGRSYVRLSVCVRSDLLTPNLLSAYCIDMSERVTSQTKTYRHVLQNP
jgi:hypothetical protein